MMTANMKELVGSRVAGVNGELMSLGAPFSVQFMSSVKTNLGEVFGFCTKPRINDDMMHPIIYWENEFLDLTNRQLAVHIIHRYLDASKEMVPGLPEIISRDYILTNVLPKVIGTDENLQSMNENKIPYELIPGTTDLMAVYYIPVEQTCGTIQITQQILDLVGISKEEISDSAKRNVLDQMVIKPMAEIMADLMGVDYIPELDDDSDGIGLTVVTIKSGMYGAGVLSCDEAYIRMSRYIGSSFYILPSSLHEVLIVRNSDTYSQDELLQMVTEINGSVVETSDRLTDNVYRYDATTGKITHCK